VKDPIAALQAYWQHIADGAPGPVPERALLQPEAIKPLLPSLLLTEFELDPFRVRYRLVGTLVDQWNGVSITGRYLEEIAERGTEGAIAHLQISYRRCYDMAAPVIGAYDWHTRHRGTLKVRFGLFPLLVNGVLQQCVAIEDYSGLPRLADY
jgi:hypothetical protein